MNRSFFWFVFALLATLVVAEQFSYKFTLPTDLALVNSAVSGTSLRLTSAVEDNAGLAYYPTKVSANLGFSTNFTWIPESCSTPTGAEGFSFFLTKDAPTWQQVSTSSGTGLGIQNVPNTYMVGYSASAGQIYVCDWTTSLTTTFAISSQCVTSNVVNVQCGGEMKIRIYFDGTLWTVYNDNVLLATVAMGMDLEHYFVGLSGSTGSSYFHQSITQWSFQSTTGKFIDVDASSMINNLNFLGTAVPTPSGSLQLNTHGSQAGVVMYNEWINVISGFKTKFIWVPSNCDSEYDGADGFAFFASVNAPSNYSIEQSQGSGLGIQNVYSSPTVGNLVMTAYSATFNEFYICNWTNPRPDSFRYVCYTVVNPTPKLTCGSNYSIEVTYFGNLLSMSVDGELKIATTNVVFGNTLPYHIGISGATGSGWFQQDIYDWSFRYNGADVDSSSSNFNSIGSATVNNGLTTLTNGPHQAGALYSGLKDISYKFESSFTWTGSNCQGIRGKGFTQYFSRLAPTASQIQTALDTLGIGNTADVYMMGYDVHNANLVLCDWGAPPGVFSSSVCSMTSMPRYTCGTSMNFKMTYNSFNMKLYVNNVLKLTRSVTIYPRYYYNGFTGLTTNSYMTQQISNHVILITVVDATQQFLYYGLPNTAMFFGSAGEIPAPYDNNYNVLKLTNGYYGTENAGLMLSPTPLTMKYGFIVVNYWNASNCDSVYSGGNGFAFVFTKAIPSNESVLASSGAGLGIQQVPNVTMIGYSSYYNEYYVCSWTSPLSGSYRNNPACLSVSNSVNPYHPQRLTCNDYSIIFFRYDGYNLIFSFYDINSGATADVVFTGPLQLDLSSPYYFGMSGSVGDGYYKQFTNYVSLRGFN